MAQFFQRWNHVNGNTGCCLHWFNRQTDKEKTVSNVQDPQNFDGWYSALWIRVCLCKYHLCLWLNASDTSLGTRVFYVFCENSGNAFLHPRGVCSFLHILYHLYFSSVGHGFYLFIYLIERSWNILVLGWNALCTPYLVSQTYLLNRLFCTLIKYSITK